MLGVKKYSQEYVDGARVSIAAHAKLAKAAGGPALEAFDPIFFNNMVLALEMRFVHRLRGIEGKDGNPLNESRMLCNSIMEHGSVATAESTMKMNPETSILGHREGEEIRLAETDFRRLADAFFAEIEQNFV